MSTARILCVDDEAHILKVVSLKLRNAGYQVSVASDGEEALELAVEERPDLIITDFQMPYMTGLDLCKALVANKVTETVPVIILTARGYALAEADLNVGNIKAMVSKPFSPRAILALVQEALDPQVHRQDGTTTTTQPDISEAA